MGVGHTYAWPALSYTATAAPVAPANYQHKHKH